MKRLSGHATRHEAELSAIKAAGLNIYRYETRCGCYVGPGGITKVEPSDEWEVMSLTLDELEGLEVKRDLALYADRRNKATELRAIAGTYTNEAMRESALVRAHAEQREADRIWDGLQKTMHAIQARKKAA